MCGIFGGGKKDNSAQQAAAQAAAREAERRARIQQGTQSIDAALAPFNDEFFGGRQSAYSAYAMPQLETQFNDARKQLIFALSRGGLLQSSAGADRQRRLNEERAQYERQVQSQAAEFSNQGRRDVEQTRANLLSQLTATEDPAAAATAAAAQAQLLNAPPNFPALGNFLFNAATGLNDLNVATTGGRGLINSGPASNIGRSSGSSSVTQA